MYFSMVTFLAAVFFLSAGKLNLKKLNKKESGKGIICRIVKGLNIWDKMKI